MHMTLDDLIEQLTHLREELDAQPDIGEGNGGSTAVYVHYQHSYPLLANLDNATILRDEDGIHVAIAAGDHPYDKNPYGSKTAWDDYEGFPEKITDEDEEGEE